MGRLRLALGILLLVGGGALAGVGYTDYRAEQANSVSFVTVEGTVQNVTVERFNTTTDAGEATTRYRAVVRYSYTYEGTEYTDDNLYRNRGEVFGSRLDALGAVGQYEEGATVNVSVEEGAPENSYLVEQSQLPIPKIEMGVGAILALVGLYFLYRQR